MEMNPTYKVLTNSILWEGKYPWRTHSEYPTLEEAMAVATRIERNTELHAMVELPNNELVSLRVELFA